MSLAQLALSPSPRNPAEPIAVQNNQQLALKVEGVVQHGSKPGLFRKIQSVCLNVASMLQSKSGQDYKVIGRADAPCHLARGLWSVFRRPWPGVKPSWGRQGLSGQLSPEDPGDRAARPHALPP